MSEVIIKGKAYKKMKINDLIIDDVKQDEYTISAEQLSGKERLHIVIEASAITDEKTES